MVKQGKQHTKLNNKGMTLVELIVSVTVLVLVSAFILSAFVTAMKMSAKSRNLHRATTVAQNVMEGINLKSAEELAYQFNYPIIKDSSGTQIANFGAYPTKTLQYAVDKSVGELYVETDGSGNVTYNKVNAISLSQYEYLKEDPLNNASAIAAAGSAYMANLSAGKYDFLADTEGKYCYYIRNLESDGAYYNARITLDASAYRSTGSSSLNSNSEQLISVPTIDSTYDAVEVMGSDYDDKAIVRLEQLSGKTVDKEHLRRTIKITVSDALMGTGSYRTKIDVEYIYACDLNGDGIGDDLDGDGLTKDDEFVMKVASPFDNTGAEDEQQLRNLYLYYYPLYDYSGLGVNDYITIDNSNNKDFEVYIIKQESGSLTQTQLRDKESHYEVSFNVVETTNNSVGNSHITLHTNWDENLYAIYASGFVPAVNQASYNRNGVWVNKDTFQTTDLKNKQTKDRIYDVTVEIFSSEKAASLSEFQNENVSDWFSSDKHLVTITGSNSR